MHPTRLVRAPLPWPPSKLLIAVLVAVVLLAEPAASITSDILIDPVGEYTGDVFGCSIAWVGDVNGDGYDDLLIGAFRYPEIASAGQAYSCRGQRCRNTKDGASQVMDRWLVGSC